MTDIRKDLETAAVAMADFEGGSIFRETLLNAIAALARARLWAALALRGRSADRGRPADLPGAPGATRPARPRRPGPRHRRGAGADALPFQITRKKGRHGVDWLAEQPAIPEYHASPETLAAIRAIDREKTEHQRPRQRRQAPI